MSRPTTGSEPDPWRAPVIAAQIPDTGLHRKLEASAAERKAIAEVGGVYIVIAAGTKILPPRFRLTSFKPWMRGALVLWWIVILLGIATYARWYVG